MNQDQIDKMQQVANSYWQAINDITVWCRQVSLGMGFDGCNDVQIYGTHFSFVAFWYGPFQSEDHEPFSFDYSDLLHEPVTIITRLQKEKKLRQEEKELERLKEEDAKELAQYEKLRKKFG